MENNSFCQRVIEAADARAGKVAMTLIGPDGAETTTFGEMLSQIRSVAYRLTQEQIAFGDRVALISENHPHWAIAYLGILYRGAIAVPLDQSANTEALAHFIKDSEAKLAFVSTSSLDKFRAVCERLGRRIPAVILRDVGRANGFERFEDWAHTARPIAVPRDVELQRMAARLARCQRGTIILQTRSRLIRGPVAAGRFGRGELRHARGEGLSSWTTSDTNCPNTSACATTSSAPNLCRARRRAK